MDNYVLQAYSINVLLPFQVIKRPMDLETVQKKVKQRRYKTQRLFEKDLELIWSNCFAYNTAPVRRPMYHADMEAQTFFFLVRTTLSATPPNL